jgi:hypothetical protein
VPSTTQKASRRVFAPGKCHWRVGGLGDSKGAPACKLAIEAKYANLCPKHEALWQAAARERYHAKQKAAIIAEYEAANAK